MKIRNLRWYIAGLLMLAWCAVSGVSLKIFSGVMIGVFFHMLNGLFSNLGAINSWSPIISALAPVTTTPASYQYSISTP